MRLMLFYACYADYLDNTSHHKYLEELLGSTIETFNVKEHRSNYNHEEIPEFFPDGRPMSETCWCDIPDETNPVWPKLHWDYAKDNNFIAAGDNILKLTKEDLV